MQQSAVGGRHGHQLKCMPSYHVAGKFFFLGGRGKRIFGRKEQIWGQLPTLYPYRKMTAAKTAFVKLFFGGRGAKREFGRPRPSTVTCRFFT